MKTYFPDCPESEYGTFLLDATAFPKGTAEQVAQQLREHREAGCQAYQEAIARTNRLMDEEFAALKAKEALDESANRHS